MDTDTEFKNGGDAAAVIETALAAATPEHLDPQEVYSVVVPAGAEQKTIDLEQYQSKPIRPRGTYKPADVESFISYVETHQDEAATTIWVHPTEGKVLAVLDDHSAQDPAWREHKVDLTLQHSPEWLFWAGQDGKLMEQRAFAEHLREGLPDILTPDGATLLEIATTFEAKTDVQFRSGVDLSSGEAKFQYDESIDATGTTADGSVAVPREFELILAPFLGEEPKQITASLRHQTKGGHLLLGYKLERPERVVEDALERVAARLDDRFKRVYRGTPAA